MSEKEFLCNVRRGSQKKRKGSSSINLVVQLNLLTQYPQIFLPPNKPVNFPNNSFGKHIRVSKISHFMSKCRIIQTACSTVQSVDSKGKAHGEGKTEMRVRGIEV